MPTCRGCSIPPSSDRSARTRHLTKRACRDAWRAPSSPAASFTICIKMQPSALAIGFALGYLLGSIPFGLLLTRMTGGPDLRTIGSGNIGATNVLRTGNKVVAAATLLADIFKGTAAVIVVTLFSSLSAALLAGLGAFLGHLFPVWLRFNGAKASPPISAFR